MATKQMAASGPAVSTYRCPRCAGTLACVDGSWGCTDCRYVPAHGAD
jgi:ribosomal protein L37AE/L43A